MCFGSWPGTRRRATWTRLGDQTAEAWLIECGQTPRLRELLWEPLVVAALNQAPATAAAAPFARVLARMFNGTRSDAAIGLPRVPLDALYAEPARTWLEARGSSVLTGTTATLAVDAGRAIGVDLRDQRIEAGAVISIGALVLVPGAGAGHRPTRDAVASTRAGWLPPRL